jgi:tetratricopeptide (TPR) repeat protein
MSMVVADRPGGAAWPQALALLLAAVLCYANSLRVPFLLDDPFVDVLDAPLDYSTRPLVWASFDLNRALSGGDTWSYHAFNGLVHLACALLLLGVLRRGMRLVAPGLGARTRAGLALATTLLWTCHPLQTSAVTYLSQRAESLAACLYLVVVYAFLRSLDASRPFAWRGLALLALALGFAVKETIATAPPFLLLLDATLIAGGPRAALRQRGGFHGALLLAGLALGLVFVVPLLQAEESSAGFRLETFGTLEYARTQPGVILHYLRLALWPHPLCFDYAWPIAARLSDWLPQTAALAALLGVTAAWLLRRSWGGVAGAFFFLFLAPTSSFVPIQDPAFEHRMYLPLAAVLLLAVMGAWWLCTRLLPRARALPAVLAAVSALACAALTVRRNQDYRTAEGLWRLTIEQAPHNARAHGNLGCVLLTAGRVEEAIQSLITGMGLDPRLGFIHLNLGNAYLRLGKVDHAISFLERGARLSEDARGIDILGGALFDKGDYLGATRQFRKALELAPGPRAHHRLAKALGMLERREEALQHLAEALRLDPGYEEARLESAALLVELGRPEEALEHLREALATPPNPVVELYDAAQVLRSVGHVDEALALLHEITLTAPEIPEAWADSAVTIGLKPDASPEERRQALRMALEANELAGSPRSEFLDTLAEALVLLGDARLDPEATAREGPQGDAARALEHLRRAVELAPDDARGHERLAETLARLRLGEEALAHFEEALRLDPSRRGAHLGLASVRAERGEREAALEHALAAHALAPGSAEEEFRLAQLLSSLGRLEEAMAAFLETCRLIPDSPEPAVAYAETVCMRRDATPEERREALRRAAWANERTGSSRIEFLAVLAMAQAALDDLDGALASLERAAALPDARANAELARRLEAQREGYLRRRGN